MIKWNIYTPEGVQDLMFRECSIKRTIEKKTIDLFDKRGFLEIQPPTIEFYDVFSGQSAGISQESMFKFFDQQGRILVLRPDLTTSAARIAATKPIQFPKPWRFSYIGNVFRFEGAGDGKLNQREFTQAGIEILGSLQPESDAEIISTIINGIKNAGIQEFQIELGQVEFFKGLMEEAQFTEEESETIREFIENKDFISLENELNNKKLKDKLKQIILEIPQMFGAPDIIKDIYDRVENTRSKLALDNLKNICEILNDYNIEKYINIDLGMVQSIDYYTGMIFRGLTRGVGSTICGGGRYDNLTSDFGETMPAVGGAIGINRLMLALNRQNIKMELPEIDTVISYMPNERKTAIQVAEELRKQGLIVEMSLSPGDVEHTKEYALAKSIKGFIMIKDTGVLEVHDLSANQIQITSVDELIKS